MSQYYLYRLYQKVLLFSKFVNSYYLSFSTNPVEFQKHSTGLTFQNHPYFQKPLAYLNEDEDAYWFASKNQEPPRIF